MSAFFLQNRAFRRMWYLGQASLTPVLQISKNGAAFTDPAAGVSIATERGSGWYYFDFQAADADTLGDLAYTFGSGSMSTEFHDLIVGFDPYDPIHLGLSALPNFAPNVPGGLGILDGAGHMPANVLGWGAGSAPALVGGNIPTFVADISSGALSKFFLTNSGKTYADAVSGSVVKETAANSGGGGGDPLNHPVPGSYGPGTAGYLLGTNLDASIKALAFFVSQLGR